MGNSFYIFLFAIVALAIIIPFIVHSVEKRKTEKEEELAVLEKKELDLEKQINILENNSQTNKEIVYKEIHKEIHKEVVYYICPYCNKKYLAELRDCPNCGAQNK